MRLLALGLAALLLACSCQAAEKASVVRGVGLGERGSSTRVRSCSPSCPPNRLQDASLLSLVAMPGVGLTTGWRYTGYGCAARRPPAPADAASRRCRRRTPVRF